MKTIISLSIALLSVIGLSAQCITEFDYTFNQSTGTFEAYFYPDANMIPNPAIQVTYTWDFIGTTLTGDVVTYDFGQNQCIVVALTATGGGCTATVYDSVFNPNIFVDTCNIFLTYNISPADDNLTPNGAIDITVQGGTAPFAYDWSNQAITEDISGLLPAIYSVEVIDDMGCVIVQSFDVPINDSLNTVNTFTTSAWYSFDNADCTATVTADVYGGTPPYLYQWSNLQTTQSFYGGCGGDLYCVTVTDAMGLIADACVSLYYVQDTSITVTNTFQSTVDTCLNVIYGEIYDYIIQNNDIIVTWGFVDYDEDTSYITITYPANDSITPGVYEIYLFVNCDDAKSMTTYSDRIQVTEEELTGIISPIEVRDYNIYPNPVSDIMNIEMFSNDYDNASLSIINATGQVVYTENININNGSNQFSISVENLISGMYFVKISGNNNYNTLRFIK